MGKSLTFWVAGEPQPFPKKRTNKAGMIYAYDPDGRKRAWAELIAVRAKIARVNWEGDYRNEGTFYFTRRHPVAVGIQVFLTQAKSNKDEYPVINPDLDNVQYTPHNVFQGIFYDDDCQIVLRVPLPEGKFWAGHHYSGHIFPRTIHSAEAGMRITVRGVG